MSTPAPMALPRRRYLVTYRLINDHGADMGGGTSRIEASYADSIYKQLNAMLSGRRHKVTESIPIT